MIAGTVNLLEVIEPPADQKLSARCAGKALYRLVIPGFSQQVESSCFGSSPPAAPPTGCTGRSQSHCRQPDTQSAICEESQDRRCSQPRGTLFLYRLRARGPWGTQWCNTGLAWCCRIRSGSRRIAIPELNGLFDSLRTSFLCPQALSGCLHRNPLFTAIRTIKPVMGHRGRGSLLHRISRLALLHAAPTNQKGRIIFQRIRQLFNILRGCAHIQNGLIEIVGVVDGCVFKLLHER